MSARGSLRAVAVALALSLATLSTTCGLLFVRPLPTVAGYFRLLGLNDRVEVVRDVYGTPHVAAENAHDLFFTQGYVTAQDRLVQMEELRASAGRALPGGESLTPISPRLQEALEAYAAGVNKLVSQYGAAKALPGELVLAGRRPPPWTADDQIRIARAFLRSALPAAFCAATNATLRGRPLLAADLYLDAAGPGFYAIDLRGAGVSAVGAALPGVPG